MNLIASPAEEQSVAAADLLTAIVAQEPSREYLYHRYEQKPKQTFVPTLALP